MVLIKDPKKYVIICNVSRNRKLLRFYGTLVSKRIIVVTDFLFQEAKMDDPECI